MLIILVFCISRLSSSKKPLFDRNLMARFPDYVKIFVIFKAECLQNVE